MGTATAALAAGVTDPFPGPHVQYKCHGETLNLVHKLFGFGGETINPIDLELGLRDSTSCFSWEWNPFGMENLK